jgi:formiminoglutamate deiminase
MYRFVARMTPEQLQAITALAFVEMLETGFTRVGEFHYLHHDLDGRAYDDPAEMSVRVAAAADEAGIGLTLLPVFYAHAGFGGEPPEPGQRRFICDIDRYAELAAAAAPAVRALPGGRLGVAPHSLRAATLNQIAALVSAFDGPVHIHAAEQVREVEDCIAWSGARPVELLLDRFDVGPRWCLVHATHMTWDETHRLAASGAVAGLCPITEANLGDGVFPGRDFVAAGGRFGVGSDSNVRIDAAEELRWLEYGQRLIHRERNVLGGKDGASTGAALFRAALTGGRQALADEACAPGIAVGEPADLVELDLQAAGLAGHRGDGLLDAFVFSTGSKAVNTVWAGGRRVVVEGSHVARSRIGSSYARALETLLE